MKLVTYVQVGEFADDIFIVIGVFDPEEIDGVKDRVFVQYGKKDPDAEDSSSVQIIDGVKYQLWGNIIIHDMEVNEYAPTTLEVKL